MQEIKLLNGGMNMDDSPYKLPPNDYIDAQNITHDAIEGSHDQDITNVIANRIGDATYAMPSGRNVCIGSYANTLRNTIIQFIWNENDYHLILEFNLDTRVQTKILANLTDTASIDVLEFTENGKIESVNVYNRDEGDLLFFIDSLDRPCGFDITLFKQGYYTPITRDLVQKAKMPPLGVPQVIYGNDTTKRANDLRNKFFRFRTRYIYDDFEKSVFSPMSLMPLPVSILTDTYTNVITNNNLITLSAKTGGRNVKSIEIGVQIVSKSNNWSDLLSVTTINKKDLVLHATNVITVGTAGNNIGILTFAGIPIAGTIVNVYLTTLPSIKTLVGTYTVLTGDTLTDVAFGVNASMVTLGLVITPFAYNEQVVYVYNNTTYDYNSTEFLNSGTVDNINFTYNFYNDSTYAPVNIEEAVQLQDYVPPYANCQELLNGNILAYAGITEGYNKDTIANSTITVGTISSGSSSTGAFSAAISDVATIPSFQLTKYALSGIPEVGTVVNVKVKRKSDHTIITASTYTTVSGDTIYTVEAALTANNTLLPDILFTYGYGNVFVRAYVATYEVITAPYFSYMEIVPPATTGNAKPTWEWQTQRTIARQYFDKNGITNGVLYPANVSFPSYSENVSNEPMLPYINYKINDIPPDWAYSFTFLVNKIPLNRLFWKSVTVNTTEADYIYFEVTSLVTNATKNPTTAAVCSYTFKDGDRVRIIRDSDTPGVVFADTYDAAIEGYVFEPSIAGTPMTGKNYIKIKNIAPFTGNILNTKNYVIKLYSPTQQVATTDNQTFFEIGRQYDIINPTLSTRTHAGEVTDQVIGSTPAEFNFYEGDSYFRNRKVAIGGVGYDSFNVMDSNVVDFYISAVSSIDGRPSVIDINARKQYYSTLIRFSQAYQANTNINGLNRFYSKNFDEYDYSFGDVQRVKVRDRQMRVFQKYKIGVVSLYSSIGKDANGLQIIFQTDKLLNPIQYYVGNWGMGTTKFLTSNRFADYFCDNVSGAICRVSNDGVQSISTLYKMNSWANDNVRLRTDDHHIYLAFDPRLNNVVIALEAVECIGVAIPSFTITGAQVGVAFTQTVTLTGTLPINLTNVVKPTGMTVVINGYDLTFSGTIESTGTDLPITFTVSNDCGLIDVVKSITVSAASCIAPNIIDPPITLPDGIIGVPYSYTIPLEGSTPFTVDTFVKPSWMTIAIVGSDVVFSGTPDTTGTSITVSFHINNCYVTYYAASYFMNVNASELANCIVLSHQSETVGGSVFVKSTSANPVASNVTVNFTITTSTGNTYTNNNIIFAGNSVSPLVKITYTSGNPTEALTLQHINSITPTSDSTYTYMDCS